MQRPEYEDDADDIGDAIPTDVFEQVAQTIVAQVRTMVEHRARYRRVDPSDFPDRDIGYYDRTGQELAPLGFHVIGDFEDASLIVTDPARRSFVRFAVGAHCAIAAMWFEVPAPDGDGVRCLVLHTWLADGRVLVTARGTIDNGLPMPAEIAVVRLEHGVHTKATVRAHGERVALTRTAPRRLTGTDELFHRYAGDEAKIGAFREEQGVGLFEPLLRTMLGENYEVQGEPILDAIQRHPEWLRGEISASADSLREDAARPAHVDLDRFPHAVIARIPEHIEPLERGSRYEDPLQDALTIQALGVITGGGSQLTPAAEIGYVDVELALADLDGALELTKRILEEAGAPVGSQLLFVESGVEVERPFGVQEGLALYLDGSSLPDEIYEQTDIDALMERLAIAADSVGGELRSAWNGPTETALYHYGPSADAMLDALQDVFDDFPICQNARLVIRQGTDGDTRVERVSRRDAA